MICAFCKRPINPLQFGRVKIKDVQQIKVLDENVTAKVPRLDLTLCAQCETEVVTMLLAKAIDEDKSEKDCDQECVDCPKR